MSEEFVYDDNFSESDVDRLISANELTQEETERKGSLLSVDDIQAGLFLAVHSAKGGDDQPAPIYGVPLEIKAVNLPFLAAQVVQAPDNVIQLDVRYYNLMKLQKEYVDAFRPKQNRHNPLLVALGGGQ